MINQSNNFDNIKVDIVEIHNKLNVHILNRKKIKRKSTIFLFIKCKFSFFTDAVLQILNINYFLIINGFKRKWFISFQDFWKIYLKGRPLKLHEFFLISFEYRKKNQISKKLDWNGDNNILNWQDSSHISSIFNYIQKEEFKPIHSKKIFKYFKYKSTILEYGCGIAPYYSLYNKYFKYLNCKWDLIDLENHTYSYSKFKYMENIDINNFYNINSKNLNNPTSNISSYNTIIIKEVFEHLPNPFTVITNLYNSLEKNGFLIFDYIISDAEGLDHPNALIERNKCLNFINEKFQFIESKPDFNQSIGLTIVKKI